MMKHPTAHNSGHLHLTAFLKAMQNLLVVLIDFGAMWGVLIMFHVIGTRKDGLQEFEIANLHLGDVACFYCNDCQNLVLSDTHKPKTHHQ